MNRSPLKSPAWCLFILFITLLAAWTVPASRYQTCAQDLNCDQSTVAEYRWTQANYWTGLK